MKYQEKFTNYLIQRILYMYLPICNSFILFIIRYFKSKTAVTAITEFWKTFICTHFIAKF